MVGPANEFVLLHSVGYPILLVEEEEGRRRARWVGKEEKGKRGERKRSKSLVYARMYLHWRV